MYVGTPASGRSIFSKFRDTRGAHLNPIGAFSPAHTNGNTGAGFAPARRISRLPRRCRRAGQRQEDGTYPARAGYVVTATRREGRRRQLSRAGIAATPRGRGARGRGGFNRLFAEYTGANRTVQ
jgi:hypothetical protein